MPVSINVKQVSPFTTEATVRTHTTLIDRPESKGGTDRGPMGGEMLLVALGGCFMSNLLEVVRTREANISDIAIDVVGDLEGTPARFTAIEMRISATHDDRDQLEKFITMAERGCIVANSIGPAINLTFTIVESDAVGQ